MKKYNDVFEGMVAELNKTSKDTHFLADAKIKWGKSDERNKNNRIYPDEIASTAIEDFNKEAQKNVGVVGQLDHPQSGSTLLSNASHLVSKVWKDKNKVWWADCKILNTTKGKDLMTVLKAGTTIGASLRGSGEVDKQGKVLPGLEIRAIDFVHSPSFSASATVDKSDVFESYIPDGEDEWDEESLKEITKAIAPLSDATVKMVQKKLEASDGIIMTEERIKALVLWIKCSKDNPNILPFNEWFVAQQKKLGGTGSIFEEEVNDGLRRKANSRAEKRMADSPQHANTLFESRKRIEDRQKKVDEALRGKSMSTKTISRLFAEACLAGFRGSRADWINQFAK